MYCRNCGKELDEQAVACTGCGVPPKKSKKHCLACGEPANETAEFCTSCGCKLAGASTIGNINLPRVNVSNLNIPNLSELDYQQVKASYGKHIWIGIGLFVCFALLLSGNAILAGLVPVSGLIVALVKAADKPKN